MTYLWEALRDGWSFQETIEADFGFGITFTLDAQKPKHEPVRVRSSMEIPWMVPVGQQSIEQTRADIDSAIHASRSACEKEMLRKLDTASLQPRYRRDVESASNVKQITG